MKEKTQIEKIIDAIEFKEKIKKEDLTVIKEKRQKDWDTELEESPYNQYYGVDMVCALTLMKALRRGLDTKDAMYISEHRYKIPTERIRDLIYKYSDDGETFYQESTNIERIKYNKSIAGLKKANKKLILEMKKDI